MKDTMTNTKLREALELAIRQNSHDMLMTGEEIRQCEQALALTQHDEDSPTLYYKALDGERAKQDGRCYDICFVPADGYTPLYTRATPPAEKAGAESVKRTYCDTCDMDVTKRCDDELCAIKPAADHVKRAGRWHMDAEQFAEKACTGSEREQFEAWARPFYILDRTSEDKYEYQGAYIAWFAWQARGQQAGDALDGIAIGYEHGAGMKNPYTMGGLVTLSYDTPEQAVAAMAIIRAAIDAARAPAAKEGK